MADCTETQADNPSLSSLNSLVRQRQQHAAHAEPTLLSQSLIKRKEARDVKPDYHPQWKLTRVISGHLGWVRAVAVEPGNQWFATGAGDRLIKVMLASIEFASDNSLIWTGLTPSDLGLGVGRTQAVLDRSYIHCTRPGSFIKASVSLFCGRGQNG